MQSIFILYGRGCFGCCIRFFDLVTQMAGYRMGTSPRQRVFAKDVLSRFVIPLGGVALAILLAL